MSLLERCPHFRGWYVQFSMESGPENVSSMELGSEDVSLLERCPHFRGWYMYIQASIELGCVPIREVSSFQRIWYMG